MPKINGEFEMEVSVYKFLMECDLTELHEVQLMVGNHIARKEKELAEAQEEREIMQDISRSVGYEWEMDKGVWNSLAGDTRTKFQSLLDFFTKKKSAFIAGFFTIMLCLACVGSQPITTEAEGIVITVEPDRVQVAFQVVSEKHGSQAINWFYCPGHRYQKGDRYPDLEKYSKGGDHD